MSAIYRGMNQSKLDAQYDQRTLVPHAGEYMARWAERSASIIAAKGPETLRYGEGPNEIMLVFGDGPSAGAGAHLHLHGGAWRQLSAGQTAFVASGLLGAGVPVAVADFSLAPAAALGAIVEEVRRAFLCLAERFGSVGVSAHSSGCHLAGMLLDPAWQESAGVKGALRGLVLASGVYDLEPVRLSARNTYLSLSEEEAAALSPHLHLPKGPPPATLLWGDGELDEFQRQSRAFAAALRAAGGEARELVLPGLNHFDVYDSFAEPGSEVVAAVRALHSPTAAAG
ncbi:MAG: alpha/beta hydrolase [Pseudomonadota bacterium]